jgi:hypothetical protein
MAHPARKETLIAELALARSELTGSGHALRLELDVGARVRSAVRARPAGWFGGAALLGLLLARLPPLQRKVEVKPALFRRNPAKEAGKAAFALTLGKFALDLAKPTLTGWVRRRIFSHATGGGR